MADAPRTHSDGTLAFGTQKVSINGVNFIIEAFNVDADSDVIQSKNEFGRPNKRVLIEQDIKGSSTLQLEDVTTKPPKIGENFSLFPFGANVANAGEAIAFIIKKVGQTADQGGEKKVPIDFLEKLN